MEGVDLRLLVIGVSVLLSSLFSGTETAVTSLHSARLEQLIDKNPTGKRFLLEWRDHPAMVLSFLLIANNVVNILASSLATSVAIDILSGFGIGQATSYAIALSVGVMTFLILVFGEVLPKTYARHNPAAVRPFLPFLLATFMLLWPIAKALAALARGLARLGGVDLSKGTPTITEEELEYLIHRGGKEGALEESQERMLSGVLELGDSIAREVMVPRTSMVMFESRDNLYRVVEVIKEHQFSRYPVYQGAPDKVIGFFYAKDLLPFLSDKAADKGGKDAFRLRNFVRPPYFVPGTKRLNELLREFLTERIHMAIVVDEYGGVDGIVTLEDVMEEMVGEIYDEYDEEEALFTKLDDTSWMLDARFSVDDIKDILGIEIDFPDEREYETVSGFVMELAGRVPSTGESFVFKTPLADAPNLEFEVQESDGAKLGKLRLRLVPKQSENAEEQ